MIEVLLFIILAAVMVYALLAIIYQIFRHNDHSLPITYQQFKAMYGIASHKWDIPGYDLDGVICGEEIEYKPGKFENIVYFRPRTYFTYLRIFRTIRRDERSYGNHLRNLKMAKVVDYFKADLEEYKQKENANHQNYSSNNERPNVDEKRRLIACGIDDEKGEEWKLKATAEISSPSFLFIFWVLRKEQQYGKQDSHPGRICDHNDQNQERCDLQRSDVR